LSESEPRVPSHLTSIGFSVDDPDGFRALAEAAAREAEVIEVYRGRYLRWSSSVGAELWLQLSREDELIGMMPHFSGGARRSVALTERVSRPDDSELDGAFHAWANPGRGDPSSGDYPFVFDCPDYAIYRKLTLPYRTEVALSAFAHELTAYRDATDFEAAQSDEPKFAPRFFVPIGLFGEEPSAPPESQALFAGEVLDTAVSRNPMTRARFIWARVRTLGGDLDVVADPELVEGDVAVGGVVRGTFWLTGRLVDYDPNARRKFLGVRIG
jgi:hypothetical protein